MPDFRRILFPVDFPERSKKTAPYVAWIARKFQSHVTLLHAFDMPLPAVDPMLQPELLHFREDEVRQRCESDIQEFTREVFDTLPVTGVVQWGDAAETIVRYAEQNEIDLIVMPTHGLGKFRWLLLGSVTAKVLHDVRCPVWTTVHSETLPASAAGEIRSVICGVDLYSDPIGVIRRLLMWPRSAEQGSF